MQNDLLLRACRQESVPRPPVWMMRQAGRIIPAYRRLRENISFQELMKRPGKVADVTLQPVDALGVDAAILFTDILIIPEAMGQSIEFTEDRGPVLHPRVESTDRLQSLDPVRPETDLPYLLESIEATLEKLNDRVPLIGFTGAPWTLACYMIEGESSRRYKRTKKLLYDDPECMEELLSRLTDAVVAVLQAKIDAGVHAVQLFDTSASTLPPGPFTEVVLPFVREVIERISDDEVPLIYYGKGTGHSLEQIVETGADVVGLDWTVRMEEAKRRVNDRAAIQGNLDPSVLLASEERIEKEARRVMQEYGGEQGHIMNLGHGVYPETDLENAKAFVRAVKQFRYSNRTDG